MGPPKKNSAQSCCLSANLEVFKVGSLSIGEWVNFDIRKITGMRKSRKN